MANSRVYLKSEAGGTTTLSRDTTANSGNLVLPAGGNVASVDTAVADNAIARFDSTTGKLQNSGVSIDDSNNVGVGTSSPKDKIHSTGGIITTGSYSGISNGGSTIMGYGGGIGYVYALDPTIAWKPMELGALSFDIKTLGTSRVIVDSAGNVGIGVTPSAWTDSRVLQLGSYSSIHENNSSGAVYIGSNIYRSGQNISNYIISGWGATLYEQNGGYHRFYTAPSGTAGSAITWTNVMTLDANANLTLGNGIVGSHIMSRYDASYYTFIKNYTAVDATPIFENVVAGVRRSAILANGTYQSATNVYGSTSDIKLKENIVDTSPKLEKLMKVQVRNFSYIGQENSKQIGVIAQEIEQVFPGVVFETKDTKQVEVTKTRDITDEDGNVTQEEYIETETVETGEVTKNVKYSIIYMMMLKGMQEMRAEYTAEINDLKARIELLEAK